MTVGHSGGFLDGRPHTATEDPFHHPLGLSNPSTSESAGRPLYCSRPDREAQLAAPFEACTCNARDATFSSSPGSYGATTCAGKPLPRLRVRMSTLVDLARAIDAASDAGDESLLRQLAGECESRLPAAQGEERVLLRYYQSNTYAAIIASRHRDAGYTWSWEQADGVPNILLLRQAIGEPAFGSIGPTIRCQVRTNLANRLSALGRPVAANEQWIGVLDTIPAFAKALASRAEGLASYARTLYDRGHACVLLGAALTSFDAALDDKALWESDDRDSVVPHLREQRNQIVAILDKVGYDRDHDLDRWSLGSTAKERSYRGWCLRERLFLNPLNDAYTATVAATDMLHLPDHAYEIGEKTRFPAYYNLMKQEYVSARYRLYRALHEEDPEFLMHHVLMLNSGDEQSLGHHTEELRSAFRSAYSVFDKIGLFLNDYFRVGLNPRDVTFRCIWSTKSRNAIFEIRKIFNGRPNWPLRGLYFLSKDLFDPALKEVAEPDAEDLAILRQQVEHRFLSYQSSAASESTETHRFISTGEFEQKTLRLLKMVREALIYLSLAVHREETLRNEPVG